jgi:hypothetical protein
MILHVIITYMYWNNPVIKHYWPSDSDPIVQSLHNGNHCLFFDPEFDYKMIKYQQRLPDLGNWANRLINQHGIEDFLSNPANHYDIANLVKLNLWIADIQDQGIVKPMLIHYDHNAYVAANGESRLRALECVPLIDSVTAFINTRIENQDRFGHLEAVTSFDQFAQLCQAVAGQQFLFRFTEPLAAYGIDWYEYDSRKTATVTPGNDQCVALMQEYLQQYPNTKFDTQWFSALVDWPQYKSYQEQSDANPDHDHH